MGKTFKNSGGEQNIAQGDYAIGRQINTFGIPPEIFEKYATKLAVTESALSSFFKTLGIKQVSLDDIDGKLREIAANHKELLQKLQNNAAELSKKSEGADMSSNLIYIEISMKDAELYQEAYEILLNKLVEWNEIAINNGASKAPYEYEVKRLPIIVNFFKKKIASGSYFITDRVSEETLRLKKSALLCAAHQHEQQLLEKSKNGWPPAVIEAAKEKSRRFKELADKIKYDLPENLADILPRSNVTVNDHHIRGKDWEWDAFISHAWEDKENFVASLAAALEEQGLKIWYDESVLKVGDSLRRSIDNGLSKSRYGIVVLSHSFLKKEWPQKELDGIFAKERNGIKVLLPIWHNISSEDIEKFSPMLADRLAVSSSKGLPHVVEQLLSAIQQS
ncbi:hypothetical protein GCAAIG_13010 [Candidatus Electronema halotolerans]